MLPELFVAAFHGIRNITHIKDMLRYYKTVDLMALYDFIIKI